MSGDDVYLLPSDVEKEFSGLTIERLARWRWEKRGPVYSRLGRQVLYQRADLKAFLRENRVLPLR